MAVPFTRLASQVLNSHNLKLHDALKSHNGIIAVLGDKGNIQFESGGGPNFRERILYGQNSNIGFRDKNAQIPTTDDDGITMASVPQRVISGSIVINRVEAAQVQGKWAIGSLLEDKKKQASTTWVQVWAEKLLQATPGASDPYTILPSATSGTVNGILQAAVPASQSGVTAGIERGDNSFWRNQYSNTSMDISAESGDATLYEELYAQCIFGSSKQDEPDFGLTDAKTIGDLGGRGNTNKRGVLSDMRILKLGFTNVMYYNAALIRESSTRMANKLAFLNTRDLKIKVLREPGISMESQDNGLGSIPAIVDPFQKDIDSLNRVALLHIVAGLVPSLLRTHGLADNIA